MDFNVNTILKDFTVKILIVIKSTKMLSFKNQRKIFSTGKMRIISLQNQAKILRTIHIYIFCLSLMQLQVLFFLAKITSKSMYTAKQTSTFKSHLSTLSKSKSHARKPNHRASNSSSVVEARSVSSRTTSKA